MEQKPNIFLSLPTAQATFIFEYILHVGKGTPANASTMKTAMNRIYGENKAQKIFSLADYFRLEAKEKAKQEGIREGMEKGMQKGREETIKKMLAEGKLTQKEAKAMMLGG